jgi:mannose-6-phosphate isomerase
MFVGITNTPRDYAWGSHGAISELLGLTSTDALEAELWLGAHHGSPSKVVDPSQSGGATDLSTWIAADPRTALGDASASRLPFLLKILAAASPLSLQAHPNTQQARAGFDRETAVGVPSDAAHRNYKDPFPKPEMIFALSETFEALCGFRSASDVRGVISRLLELDATSASPQPAGLANWLDQTESDEFLRDTFIWLISRGEGVDSLIDRVVAIARERPSEFPIVVMLADAYPGDPGIVISLLTHYVRLERGEALYLPAGNIHAYLNGVGVELMIASDNVLRGGLTPKHIDTQELLEVLDFRPVDVPYLRPNTTSAGTEVFDTGETGLVLARIVAGDRIELAGPAIVMCAEGFATISGRNTTRELTRGDIVYVTPDEEWVDFEITGIAFLAMSR